MCLNQAFLRKWLHYSQNKHTFRGMWFFCEALCFLNRQGQARDACLRFDLHFSPILCKENSGILLGIPILVRKIQQNSTVKNMVFVAHEIFPSLAFKSCVFQRIFETLCEIYFHVWRFVYLFIDLARPLNFCYRTFQYPWTVFSMKSLLHYRNFSTCG